MLSNTNDQLCSSKMSHHYVQRMAFHACCSSVLIRLVIGSPCIAMCFVNIQWVFYYALNICIACQSLLIALIILVITFSILNIDYSTFELVNLIELEHLNNDLSEHFSFMLPLNLTVSIIQCSFIVLACTEYFYIVFFIGGFFVLFIIKCFCFS